MKEELTHVVVQPHYQQRDKKGRVSQVSTPLVDPHTGQSIVLTVSAAEWEDGWDWKTAFSNLRKQLSPSTNGANRQQRRQSARVKDKGKK